MAVVEAGSMARAAEALGLTSSGVGRAIGRLETRVEGMNNFRSRPQLQQAVNQSGASIHRRRQQLVQIGVKLREQLRVHAEQAEMSADALQRMELASRDQALLDLAVARWKEHVRD
jgi:hypothetical protein